MKPLLVNGKRQPRSKFASEFMEEDAFRRVDGLGASDEKRPVFVRCIESGNEMGVLCRSAGRRDKENAIADGAEHKRIEGLEKLHARILRNEPRLKLDQGSFGGNLRSNGTGTAICLRKAGRPNAVQRLDYTRLGIQGNALLASRRTCKS